MVFPDFSFEPRPSSAKPALRLPSVTDRLLAMLVDFLIFSPVLGLLSSGFLRDIRSYLVVDPESSEATLTWILLMILVVTLAIFLEATFLYFWKATPGQKFFQIELRSWPHGGALRFDQVLVRSALWWVSMPLFLPLLSLYTHPLRRALHDRASDTVLVTLKSQGDPGPVEIETKFFLSWGRMFAFMAFLIAVVTFWRTHSLIQSGHFTRIEMGSEGILCEEIPAEVVGIRRLDHVVALFLSGMVDRECVEKEADVALWNLDESEKPFANLAKGLATDDDKVSQKYMAKVCELKEDGEACELAKVLSKGDSVPTSGLGKKVFSSLSARVFQLRDAVEKDHLVAAAALIRDLRTEKIFEAYLDREEVRTVWKIRKASKGGRQPASSELQEMVKEFEERYELQ